MKLKQTAVIVPKIFTCSVCLKPQIYCTIFDQNLVRSLFSSRLKFIQQYLEIFHLFSAGLSYRDITFRNHTAKDDDFIHDY